MGKLFYIMGKSATGKDTIYSALCQDEALSLKKVIMYTTRPIRDTEQDGREYFFVDDARADELTAQGRVIELRAYNTVHGVWKYFTVDDANIDLEHHNYIAIGTLESYAKIRGYYGDARVVPVYIEVEDGLRLARAFAREQLPQNRKYVEMCRRFVADDADYAQDKLTAAGIEKKFSNNAGLEECITAITAYIRKEMSV